MRTVAFRIMVVMLVGAVGCQGDGRLPTHKVHGRLSFRSQTTPGARVAFIPVDARLLDASPRIRPNGRCDALGNFTLTTYLKDDGAPAGEYRVMLYWDRNAPSDDDESNEDDRPAPRNALPPEYGDRDKTPLSFIVQAKENEATFDIK